MKKIFLITLVLSVFSEFGLSVSEYIPIQEKAQGQSLAGSNSVNDSLYSNPAAASLVNVYSVEGTIQFPKTIAVSILDTKTAGVGGGLGYFRQPYSNDHFAALPQSIQNQFQNEALQGFKLSLVQRINANWGAGIAGKTVWGLDREGNKNRMNDVDVGIIFNGGTYLFGATTRNSLGGKPQMGFEREFAVGGKIAYQDTLSISMATQSTFNNPKPYQYGFGMEYTSPYQVSLKGGYRTLAHGLPSTISPVAFESRPSISFWSAGLSFVSPKLSLHYALEIPTTPNAKLEHILAATMLL